jgi:sugar O-acyltransferase (sialic acid O-acetyltransferase NeuD family)
LKNIALIGYSGHAYVAFETFFSQGLIVSAYTDREEKKQNPFSLKYLGDEREEVVIEKLLQYSFFVSIGDNNVREKVSSHLISRLGQPETAMHKTAIISRSAQVGYGSMFAPRIVVNPLAQIGNGVICNTGCIIEHECIIKDYAHIAPGAVLAGNVTVGERSFIGAGAVVKQGIIIGKNVVIGAGAVIIRDIEDNTKVVGNPQRIL